MINYCKMVLVPCNLKDFSPLSCNYKGGNGKKIFFFTCFQQSANEAITIRRVK